MKAPDKIYLQACGDCPGIDSCQSCKFDDLEGVTWAEEKVWEKDIEYIRKEALLKWLNDSLSDINGINFEEDNYDAGLAHAYGMVISKLQSL